MPNVTMDVQKSRYGSEELKEYAKRSSQTVITENEDKSKGITNDSFYHSNQFVGKDLFWQNLDLTYCHPSDYLNPPCADYLKPILPPNKLPLTISDTYSANN